MEAMAGAITVRLLDCETPAYLAEMLVVPAAAPVTRPLAFTVAMDVTEELHATSFVMSALDPSVYLPVAVNWTEVFTGREDALGDNAIETKFTAALATLRLADPCTLLEAAVMVALPRLEPVATPAAVMLATVESEELHCAVLVTS